MTLVVVTPAQETRVGRKHLRGVSSNQQVMVLDPKNSLPDLDDAPANLLKPQPILRPLWWMGSLSLPPTELGLRRMVVGGKVDKCVGKAFLLPKDMSYEME